MRRILVVDDHKAARTALASFLEVHGFVCLEAENGKEGLAYFERGQAIDLVITDNQMPHMTGLQFIIRVVERLGPERPPIILYSGNLTPELQAQALEAGVAVVLEKPYSFPELLAMVSRMLT